MKATIDIKTPAGKSLEGFPYEFLPTENSWPSVHLDNRNPDKKVLLCVYQTVSGKVADRIELHKGDTITIRIEE